MVWSAEQTAGIRQEFHYGDRWLQCFGSDRPATIDSMLRRSLARGPEQVALVMGDRRLTYHELDGLTERVAGNLYAAGGVQKGDRVALLLHNCLEFAIAFLACARLGAVAVPLNTRLAPPEMAYMLRNAGVRTLIADDRLYDKVRETIGSLPEFGACYTVGEQVPGTRAWAELERPAQAPAVAVGEEEAAAIIYTSGTTGVPKGAVLTHLNFAHTVIHYERGMNLTASDRTVIAVPVFHITGLAAQLLTMIHVGGRTIILPEFKAEPFLEAAEREGMTHTLSVPAIYTLCLMHPKISQVSLKSWRVAAFGGAPMPTATIEALTARFPEVNLVNVYGATETCSPTTILPLGAIGTRPDSVGIPVMCAECRVVDDEGLDVPRGQTGELLIRGPMVIPGYWNMPEATAKSFVDGYWCSGDLACMDEDGFVFILDRKKDMIVRGGYKVYSVEVEQVLYQHPDIQEAAVVGVDDPVLGERVKAVVVPKEGKTVEMAELRAFCAAHLADYKVPEILQLIDLLPRNPGGKVLKNLLRNSEGVHSWPGPRSR